MLDKMKTTPELTNSRPCFKEIPEKLNEHLINLGAPHVNSFDEMLNVGLANLAKRIYPVHFQSPAGERISFKVESIWISKPQVPMDAIEVRTREIYPTDARQLHVSYGGMCSVRLSWTVNDIEKSAINMDLGEVPIMLRSAACNLHKATPADMVKHGEHDSEWGGIFVIRGNEKIVRMLMLSRRNYPICVKRSTWKDRGHNFSELGILVQTVRDDEVSFSNVLHYLNNGTARFMFSHYKRLSYIPVCLILKCLMDYTDEEIYNRLVHGYEWDQYYVSCVQAMLREVQNEGVYTHGQCRSFMGTLFRGRLYQVPEWRPDEDVTDYILKERIMVHLDNYEDKFNLIVFMIQKLFQCAQGKFKVENVDAVMMQEVLLPGHLYQKYLGERLEQWLTLGKKYLQKKLNTPDVLINSSIMYQSMRNAGGIGRAMESFLATGNVISRGGMGLMQNSGMVIMAENINRMRYMSHFRAVHRGSYFTTMRTTDARQLLPDAWGFICPVHTPDGTPCGLLNHLSLMCEISPRPDPSEVQMIPQKLVDMGMLPISARTDPEAKLYVVFLDGKHLGHIMQTDAHKIVEYLRFAKITGKMPKMMEIAFIPYRKNGQFPGLFLYTGPARMMRPVWNLKWNKIEYIGTLEQVYMEIAIDKKEVYPDFTTHLELAKTSFMSNLANLIPMPDYNQSPRNMYQCQMGKQTMGTPCLNWPKQAANKLYRLQTPGTPLFRPVHYDNIGLDDFAMGTNAIVAVISYTGYDMEDAMIINKAAYERGFAYGSIYKSKFIELDKNSYFARSPHMPELVKHLDTDGLPHPGTKLSHGSPLYSYFDGEVSTYKVAKLDEAEDCMVDSVRQLGSFELTPKRNVCITLRVPRPATIGDKFASRAGQKGICSQKYPAEDLPFTESGLIPDIVFNPHGFPSRMTIAMMIETMAGKSAAVHGTVYDATPFRFSEKNTAINYFGKMLEAGGYNYYGTERLYSGIDGREMKADIFFGVVHYQRLRHMVFDKWQVRSTGAVESRTHQPIKGRKRGGGVRFGEMERDALISHGASFLLQDRLFHNSDKTHTLVCHKCGSILSPMQQIVKRNETGGLSSTAETCRLCGDSGAVSLIEIPFSYKFLVTELSSVNINARFKLTEI
ncbi:DNA-directed RNA polymerase I subunit RPA2 [Scaptodrosophila lebanonensis]|uniref:DNA-directed RNA polymerase subunit beta n=1 Tax=Drosophila lebanonensis TaxID=7225 RepID=A0A6J2U5V2_DROLE|nr:DNA-directed RNA polymerase I subunit RPA2 [Scaptodrosophila lebanonensis]